jgi:integrase
VSVLAYAGLVAPEVAGLRWPDIGEREIKVRTWGSKVDAPPARRVPMIEPLARDLQAWRLLNPPPGPRALVFPGSHNVTWGDAEWTRWRHDVFQPAVRACGLDLELPLDLRDTYCTLLINERVPVREIARRIGETRDEVRHLYNLPLTVAKALGRPAPAAALVEAARAALAPRAEPVAERAGGQIA